MQQMIFNFLAISPINIPHSHFYSREQTGYTYMFWHINKLKKKKSNQWISAVTVWPYAVKHKTSCWKSPKAQKNTATRVTVTADRNPSYRKQHLVFYMNLCKYFGYLVTLMNHAWSAEIYTVPWMEHDCNFGELPLSKILCLRKKKKKPSQERR